MFSVALIKALQVYGIAIAVSLVVAVLIKVMVVLTGRIERRAVQPAAQPARALPSAPPPLPSSGIPDEVVAAISGALAVAIGPHRVLHIAESRAD